MQLHHPAQQEDTKVPQANEGPAIDVTELSGAEAAEIALLDLAISDEAWLDEDETTEYAPPAGLLDDFSYEALTPLFNMEAERMDLADLLEPEAGGFDPLSDARRSRPPVTTLDDPWFRRH